MSDGISTTALIVLEARLPAHRVDTLLGLFRDALGNDADIDASGVKMLSTPCIQIMLSAAKTWKIDGRSLRIVRPSQQFCESIERIAVDMEQLQAVGESA